MLVMLALRFVELDVRLYYTGDGTVTLNGLFPADADDARTAVR